MALLVRHHLLLFETATRRDLNDEKVVVNCARMVGTVERLKMLYLLTRADAKATGPKVWNEWVANLVQELFFKTLNILEGGELATPGASHRAKTTKNRVRRETTGKIEGPELDRYLEAASPRYILNTPAKRFARHLDMVRTLEKEINRSNRTAFALDAREDEQSGCWTIDFIAKDRPGLFSDVAGVLALNNINILSAEIYTWRDGTAVDLFQTTRPLDALHPHETWDKVSRNLHDVFAGKLSLSYRLSQKARPSLMQEHGIPLQKSKVHVDNQSSDFFTLIEVFADDQVGLLHKITHTLTNLRLDIRIAKISTKRDQVADIFYVRDLEGQKLEDERQITEIKAALLHALEGET